MVIPYRRGIIGVTAIWFVMMVVSTCASDIFAADAQLCRDDRYTPIPHGWQIRLRESGYYENIDKKHRAIDPVTTRLKPNAPIGLLRDNPRDHRRPLFPPSDKTLIFSAEECAKAERTCFCPMILAYNEPRFLFDYHSAGGLLGHLRLGLAQPGGGKWLHEWSQIDVQYVDGRMDYVLHDEVFEGTTIKLSVIASAESVGLICKIEINGAPEESSFFWAYGGATAFFTNWRLNSAEFQFDPKHCAKDVYTIKDNVFELTRAFDESDAIVSGEGTILGDIPCRRGWKAHIKGGSSWRGAIGFGSPEGFAVSPGELLAHTDWPTGPQPQTKANCVGAQKVSLSEGTTRGFIVVGMGNKMEELIRAPQEAYKSALARNSSISARITTHTPDVHLDAAMAMIAHSTEGMWASQAYVHGGWTWREAYLGWRILYGPTLLGWTERVRKTIENQCRLGYIDEGPDQGTLGSMLEHRGLYYNMNEVFFDMVRHYFDYTSDLQLMREIFPVFQTMLDRQNRRLLPEQGYLYENSLNTWISDAHWYTEGQCTQSSAYMLRAYEFMAELARRLHKDDAPYQERAAQIRAAMQRVLWLDRQGVYAEYLDTRGHRLLHCEPELPTIYHSAEFGAANALQIYQMLHWADTQLRQEQTPESGLLYWSSNWFPNYGRSYTHSSYELAYGEEFNLAETYFLAGRPEKGYALLRAGLSGIFNGPTPGGLSCHAYVDGLQRANDEFADSVSMWTRAIVEGLFGIKVDRPRGCVKLSPQLPHDWPEASIKTPHFSYHIEQGPDSVKIEWDSPVSTTVQFRLPIRASSIQYFKIGGATGRYRLQPSVGLTWLEAETKEATNGTIAVAFVPDDAMAPDTMTVRQGDDLALMLPGSSIADWTDPQGLLTAARIEGGALHGKIDAEHGPGLLFVSESKRRCPRWLPIFLDIKPVKPIEPRRWAPPELDGYNLDHWSLIDLNAIYNADVPQVPKLVHSNAIAPAMPASQIGFNYWKDHLTVRSQPPCDEAWRAKVGPDGLAWTADGIPFKTAKEGSNIGVVTRNNRTFSERLSFSARAKGRVLYLMIGGMTFPVQSHVVNLRVTLRYADGSEQVHDLVNPFDIGDCWNTGWGPHFDTPANGFENIGGRRGPAGTSQVKDLSKPVLVDTIAHLVGFDLKPGIQLDTVEIEAIANDVIFGVMGASVLK